MTSKPVFLREPDPWAEPRNASADLIEMRARVSRLLDSHFNREGRERVRISIPARPSYDDDLCLMAGLNAVFAQRDAALSELTWQREEVERLSYRLRDAEKALTDAGVDCQPRLLPDGNSVLHKPWCRYAIENGLPREDPDK